MAKYIICINNIYCSVDYDIVDGWVEINDIRNNKNRSVYKAIPRYLGEDHNHYYNDLSETIQSELELYKSDYELFNNF